jgi:hypothetical protein
MKYFLCKIKIMVYNTIDDRVSAHSSEEYRLVKAKSEKDVEDKIKNYFQSVSDKEKYVVVATVIHETIE